MAESMSFPSLNSIDIAQNFQDIIPEEVFTEEDFKSPQPNRIYHAFSLLLEYVTGLDISRLSQSQFAALQETRHPEHLEPLIPVLNFTLALQRVMMGCCIRDFKLQDLLQPKPKRTRRFLSALINFARFRDCRSVGYEAIKEEILLIQEQHAGRMKTINGLKERINQIKLSRAEEEAQVDQIKAAIEEESQTMATSQRAQADNQRDIGQIKMAISEKSAQLEQLNVSSLNGQESANKLRSQVVQSPERMKADIARKHSTVTSQKQTKLEKGQRLQEVQSQSEGAATWIESSEQSVGFITSINTLLAKEKEAQTKVERVRDQIQSQQGALRDANAREGHFCRLRESKQEKVAKLHLHHQHAVAAYQENIGKTEENLGNMKHKQEEAYEKVKCFQEPMMLLQKQMSDKENIHEEEMMSMKETFTNLLQTLDAYHKKLTIEWDENNPQKILSETTA